MKRVLIFSLAYFPKHVGGAEVAIKEITDRCSDIEFHMVTNRFDSTLQKEERIGNVVVHRIGITTANPSMVDLKKLPLNLNKLLFQFGAAWKGLVLHRRYHFDATWGMMAHSCGVPAAIFKMAHPSVPFVLTLQEGDPIEYIERKMRPLWPLFSRAFTTADTIQAISNFLGRWARARGFTGRLEIIPNAVNTSHFSQHYPQAAIDAVKDELGKRMGEVYVITTSRLVTKNAVDDMIRALPLLPENVSFVVLGTGPDEAALKKLATDLHVSERVKWLGQIGHADMPKYLKACDIFIRASRSEGMGNSFVEAMAAELPVVATQEGGIADFLFDEKRNPGVPITGWAVDKDSPREIAAAIRDIMDRPEKVRAVVKTAKEMVIEKYDWNLIAKDMREKVFGPLLNHEAR
jgi:glycosyltransferase involved in cell wall biosynthesis